MKRLENFENQVQQTFERLKLLDKNILNDSYENFLKLYLLISSRSFGLDLPEKTIDALVPYADMFNTDLTAKPVYWYFDDENNFIVESLRDINPFEELKIRYSDGHNTDYLLYYGFTIDNNQNGKIYDFEIINEGVIHFLNLNAKPSIKTLNLEKMRKNYQKQPRNLVEEIKIISNIVKMVKESRESLMNSIRQNDISLEYDRQGETLNFKNIKNVIKEEIYVYEQNLVFLEIILNLLKCGYNKQTEKTDAYINTFDKQSDIYLNHLAECSQDYSNLQYLEELKKIL
jgi:hypothetical protein